MERPCLLGVERSLTGRRWTLRPTDERSAMAISQRLDLPDVAARVMVARGIGIDEAERYLDPTLRDFLPDPSLLKDMDRAVERLSKALRDGETVAVFGDYDVDGATSTALLVRFLRAVGGKARPYIPDRLAEGYGPNTPALLMLKEEGATVVVTVDCGITAQEPLEAAAAAGLDVIVVDHHEAEPALPPAAALVNPNRLDDDSGFGHMAAVGVAFLVVVALNRSLRASGWYRDRPEPDLLQWLDMVALGTVCDVVPLKDVNRALVTQGIKVLARRTNEGLKALSDVAGIKEKPAAYHLGFILGPRINAGGRVGKADLGARLLTCDDPAEALSIAQQLEVFNTERREIEAYVLLEAIEQVESRGGESDALVFASGESWHPGVVGIVASRLKDRYASPACVAGIEGDIAKGSGRSVRGVDLGAAVLAARQEGLLLSGGGHAMAAGFTVHTSKLEAFRTFLSDRLAGQIGAAGLVPTLELDGAVSVAASTPALVETLARLGPFGSGNAEPRFAIADARIVKADIVGQGHVRVILSGQGGGRLKGIAFRSADSDMGLALLNSAGETMHLAGTLRADTWQGRTEAQLFIEDAAPAGV